MEMREVAQPGVRCQSRYLPEKNSVQRRLFGKTKVGITIATSRVSGEGESVGLYSYSSSDSSE